MPATRAPLVAVLTTAFATAFVAALLAPAAHAQDSATLPAPAVAATLSKDSPRPSVVAHRREGRVAIDGRLDDAAWAAAAPVNGLIQFLPDAASAGSERTEIRVLYDDAALYIGARLHDRERPRSRLMRRDQAMNSGDSDHLAIVLDPFRDRSTAIRFDINPHGVKGDFANGDGSYEPVWEGAASVDTAGWSAELRIPLSQLQFPRDSVQTWGMQVWRQLARRNETQMWAYWRNDEPGGARYFGTVEGLRFGAQPRRLELLPYAVSRAKYERARAGDPYRGDRETGMRVGGDAKYSLTSNLTLDATINPDFGQVEVDPATLNLSAFETTFQERRPFFVANAGYFSFGGFSCFNCSNASGVNLMYTRRVGRAPQLVGAATTGADYVDVADNTPILGAAKITGRTRNGWQIGIMNAVTGDVDARYRVPDFAEDITARVEPPTNYFGARIRKDLRNGDTRVGMITTFAHRFLGDTLERSRLRSDAGAVGADVNHWMGGRRYLFNAYAVVSDVRGDTGALRRTQQSSAHYFSRPDRSTTSDGLFDVAWDPTRTALNGYSFYTRLSKESGDWMWELTQNQRSPGFEVNDLGSQSRSDFRFVLGNVVRRWTRPGSWYRDAWTSMGAQAQYNYDGDRTDGQVHAFAGVTTMNYWWWSIYAHHRPAAYDAFATRGGPIVRATGHDYTSIGINGDQRGRVTWNLGGQYGRSHETAGWFAGFSPGITIRPSSQLLVSLSPSFNRDVTDRQYVTSVADPAATAFSGRRYLFATLDQRTLSMSTRVNATFSPTLTLELFAQPFLASGAYTAFKEYDAPRSVDVSVFGRDVGTIQRDGPTRYRIDPDAAGAAPSFTIGDPDFGSRSVRGTAVLRWEYRPGSTFYAVWTQQRSGATGSNALDAGRDVRVGSPGTELEFAL